MLFGNFLTHGHMMNYPGLDLALIRAGWTSVEWGESFCAGPGVRLVEYLFD
jgi:hypothetical protein